MLGRINIARGYDVVVVHSYAANHISYLRRALTLNVQISLVFTPVNQIFRTISRREPHVSKREFCEVSHLTDVVESAKASVDAYLDNCQD